MAFSSATPPPIKPALPIASFAVVFFGFGFFGGIPGLPIGSPRKFWLVTIVVGFFIPPQQLLFRERRQNEQADGQNDDRPELTSREETDKRADRDAGEDHNRNCGDW